ncbi:hypothetical protein [Brevundimonas sp. M20]|uniref:hypothetical protein n=1 Tax=Brevundimonas sp. M20 TaxID=2591463 RepID=UPI00114728E8|nr:hypothetical protein [Brevundimonas sp. M20]QDH72088.1 hypothetical protein FKQ52_00825 [Brevundimonas sp. M20]
MSRSDQLQETLARLLEAETGDLRALAELAGGDPATFYIGTSLKGVDVRGQDLRGMILPNLDIDHARHDVETRIDEVAEAPPWAFSMFPLVYVSEADLEPASFDRLRSLTPYLHDEKDREAFLSAAEQQNGPIIVLAWEGVSQAARAVAAALKARDHPYVMVIMESERSFAGAMERRWTMPVIGPVLSVPRVSRVHRSRMRVLPPEGVDALGVLWELWHDRERLFRGEDAFFVRARGIGPDRQVDAAAQVFDRMAIMGVAVSNMSLVAPLHPRRRHGVGIDPVAKRLLRGRTVLEFVPHWSRTPFDIGVFGDLSRLRHTSAAFYTDTVAASLSRRGLTISGRRGHTTLLLNDTPVRLVGDDGRKREPLKSDLAPSLDMDVTDVHTVVVSERADLTMIVGQLGYGELWATCRDVMALDTDSPNLWIVVAAQLRRVSRAMGGQPKQAYLAWLLRCAFRRDAIELRDPWPLIKVLNDDHFPDLYELSISYLEPARFGVRARLKVRARYFDSPLPQGGLSLHLTVDPDGITVQEGPFAR